MRVDRFVYVISAGPYAKIGTSENPRERLLVLRRGEGILLTPTDLDRRSLRLRTYFTGDASTERALHAIFEDLRVIGEWFALDGRLQAWLSRLPAVPEPPEHRPAPSPGVIAEWEMASLLPLAGGEGMR